MEAFEGLEADAQCVARGVLQYAVRPYWPTGARIGQYRYSTCTESTESNREV